MARDRIYPLALNTAQLARALGCDRKLVYGFAKQVGLHRYKLGCRRFYLVADVVDAIREHLPTDN